MHTGLGTCCAECAQKSATLGMLGWLPSGFGNVNTGALTENEVRTFSLAGAAVNGATLALGVYLWKRKHPIIGGILGFIGGSSLAFNAAQVVTGKRFLGG